MPVFSPVSCLPISRHLVNVEPTAPWGLLHTLSTSGPRADVASEGWSQQDSSITVYHDPSGLHVGWGLSCVAGDEDVQTWLLLSEELKSKLQTMCLVFLRG